MEALEDALAQAREAVRALALGGGAPAAKEAGRLIREVERAVEYAQREAAMGEPSEAARAVLLSRLQQVERAARELKATVRRILKSPSEGTLPVSGDEARALLPPLQGHPPQQQQHGHAVAAAEGDGDGVGVLPGDPSGPASSSSSSSLFSSRRRGRGGGTGGGGAIDVVGESREVTQSLARTRELMQQELRRMGGVVEVIEEDSEAITDTHQAHCKIGSALDRADALLKRLKRQEQLDRMAKRLSFLLFLSTVAFIVARRVWLPDLVAHYRLVKRAVGPLLPNSGGRHGGQPVSVKQLEEGEATPFGERAREAWRQVVEGVTQGVPEEEEAKAPPAVVDVDVSASGEIQQELHHEEDVPPPPQQQQRQQQQQQLQPEETQQEHSPPPPPPPAHDEEAQEQPPPVPASSSEEPLQQQGEEEEEEGGTDFVFQVKRFDPTAAAAAPPQEEDEEGYWTAEGSEQEGESALNEEHDEL